MIKFYYVSKTEYDSLGKPETDSLYFCSNGYLYKGKTLIATASEAEVASLASALNDVITVVETHDTSILNLNTALEKKAEASNVYTKSEIDSKVSTLNTSINGKVSTSDFNTLKNTVTTNETDIETKVSALQKKDTSHDTSISEINEALEDKVSSTIFGALEETVTGHTGSIGSIETNIAALQKQDTNLGNSIASNASDITTLTKKVGILETDNATNKTNISTNTSNISKNTSSISSLSTTVTSSISTLEKNISANATNIQTNKTNISTNASNISDVSKKVSTLVGTDTDKSVRDIAATEVAKIVAKAPEDFDTLEEISDWISGHGESAAAMNSSIQTNTVNISNLGTALETEIEDRKTAISNEASVRANTDTEIKNLIGTGFSSTSTVTSKVNTLTSELNAEKSERQNVDAEINGIIGTGFTNSTLTKEITTLKTNLSNEITRSQNADSSLEAGIEENKTSIATLDNNLSALQIEVATNTGGIDSNREAIDNLSSSLSIEIQDREDADSSIKTDLATAQTTLNTAIQTEADTREKADDSLRESITTNANNIKTNTTNISTNTANIKTNTTAINSLKTVASSSANGLMSADDKAFLDFIKQFFTVGDANQITIGSATLVYDSNNLKVVF